MNKYIDKLFSKKFGYLVYFSYLIYSYNKTILWKLNAVHNVNK